MSDFNGVPKFPKRARVYSISDEAAKGLDYLANILTSKTYTGKVVTSRLLESIGLFQLQVSTVSDNFSSYRDDGLQDAMEGRPDNYSAIYQYSSLEGEQAYKRGYMEGIYRLHCAGKLIRIRE